MFVRFYVQMYDSTDFYALLWRHVMTAHLASELSVLVKSAIRPTRADTVDVCIGVSKQNYKCSKFVNFSSRRTLDRWK